LGRLFDVATDRTLFGSVLRKWLARDDQWRGARNRFDKCTAHQLVYDEDRIVGAANMFDLLPDSYVGPKRPIPETSRRAIAECRRILKEGRISPGDNEDPCNEALRWIGRIHYKSLRQKIHYRAEIVLKNVGDRLPELKMVIGEAVKRRNLYVHGPEEGSPVNYGESGSLIFLTSTLEFVFGASDLIEAGWDAASWMERRTGDHSFGRYIVDYIGNLEALKRSMGRC